MTTTSALRLCSPADVLSIAPYLMGFHPSDSLVILGMRGRELRFHVRGDLPADPDDGKVLAEEYGWMFYHHRIDAVVLIGYGPPAPTESFMIATQEAMDSHGIEVHDLLRAQDGRYWSLLCQSDACCPPEGRPYDPTTSAAVAAATVAGLVALPDREAVVRNFAGPTGPALQAMEEAGDQANLRVLRLIADRDVAEAVTEAGLAALDVALERYAAGKRLTDDEVAWLVVLLQVLAFRDQAWLRIDHDGRRGRRVHEQLYTDLVRRGEPHMIAPAAMLLAYITWRGGNGLIATIALDRALAADPAYSGARLMAEILKRSISPSELPPVTEAGRHPVRRRRRAARRRKC